MGVFKCDRTQKYKSEQRVVRDPYTNDMKVVTYSLKLCEYDDTYFNTKHIVHFISKKYERDNNYTTYQIVLVYPKNYHEMQNKFVIEYFDEDERDRDLKILIKLIEND